MPASMVSLAVGVLLLGLMASLAVPSATPAQQHRLLAEAEALQGLIDLAYSSSVSTGSSHAISWDRTTREFAVFEADTSTTPITNLGVIYHPVTRQPATMTLPDNITLTPNLNPFAFGGGGDKDYVAFDNWGYPYGKTGSVRFALTTSDLRLPDGAEAVIVRVTATSGLTSVF